MFTEVCQYLKNWFDWNQPKYYGRFNIVNGVITLADNQSMDIKAGQYYRIIGSVFNDGVHKYNDETDLLDDEEFEGAVWLMAIPKDLIALVGEIQDWQNKYAGVNSVNMSPYQSESFGGYSYSKASGGSSNGSDSIVPTWKSVFRDRLWRYKKI